MTVVVKSGSKDKFNPMQHTIIGQISYEKVTNLRRVPTSVYYRQVHDLEQMQSVARHFPTFISPLLFFLCRFW